MSNFEKYYSLEKYLFNDVKNSFHKKKYLTPEEFFCIVIWKANRAKSKVKEGLLSRTKGSLKDAVCKLTQEIYNASNDQDRLKLLWSCEGIGLPMASAILTVLYPETFTVYDARVAGQVGNATTVDAYFNEFIPAVKKKGIGQTLRDKDKYLWGKSFYEDLKEFVRE